MNDFLIILLIGHGKSFRERFRRLTHVNEIGSYGIRTPVAARQER
jgi:hypothetical protein